MIIDTGIQIQLPLGTYGRIASRSGIVVKHHIEVKAGVIDPDHTGTLKVVLHNFGTTAFTVNQGDRIAQLILEKYNSAHIQKDYSIHTTERGVNGFGSTGITLTIDSKSMQVSMLQALELKLSWNEPIFIIQIIFNNRGTHQTKGLILKSSEGHVKIDGCETETPTTRIHDWRNVVKYSRLSYGVNIILLYL